MDVFRWIRRELQPRACTSGELVYDDVESQSGRSLPVIYQPFDASRRPHFQDRGSLFDYLFSTEGEGKRLLDFGPGDGWPSLIVAPFVNEVVGVEGSARRAEVCTDNARRLGIHNARFIHVAPGTCLPFPDNSFDGATAASSVEQTPDPKATLHELFRVLRPGGRLRMNYESLSVYRNGRERDVWLVGLGERTCRLILFDRHIDRELAWNYGLTLAMSRRELADFFSKHGCSLSFDSVTIQRLEELRPAIVDARVCLLSHPCGLTLASWLRDIGFREVTSSYSGAWFAGQLFDQLSEEDRPKDVGSVDAMLRPLVRIVVRMAAPPDVAMITAVK